MGFRFVGSTRDKSGRNETETARFRVCLKSAGSIAPRMKVASLSVSPLVLLLFVIPAFGSGTQNGEQPGEADGNQSRQQTTATPEKQAKERLHGIWVFVTLTDKQEDRMLVVGDRMYWCVGEKTRAGSFTVDASKEPKHIDIKLQDGDRTVAIRGIYRIQKCGWLFLNLAEEDKSRPIGFKGEKFKEGEGGLMFRRGQQEIEIGNYTGEVNGKMWTLVLDKTNRLTIMNEKRVVVAGTFIAKRKEMVLLSDKTDAATEKVNTNYGNYRWTRNGKTLSFTVIKDDLNVRASAVTATKWLKSEQR